MSRAAARAGRKAEFIKLVAVTKTFPTEVIKEAIQAGLKVFGENRIQEAKTKIKELSTFSPAQRISWHLVGHLQSNKAGVAIQLFDLIHSIDSLKLAEEVNRQAEKAGKIQRILVQVKLSEEETKHGVSGNDLPELLQKISTLKNLQLEGLMTMPPFFDEPEKTRPYYARLRELRDDTEKKEFRLPDLSMGMSNDYEVAIEEGATMVRIGTALFGERNQG